MLIAPALIATLAFACDDDETKVTDGVGGSGGGGGTAGSGGGSSGSAGTGGSAGTAGSAGTGGNAGTAGTGGSGGTGGTAGTAGTGGTGDPPDGGVDGGDASAPLTAHQQTTATICGLFDQVDPCQPAATGCRDAQAAQWESFQAAADPSCAATIDAYFNCLATEPLTSFDCNGDGSTPQAIVPNPGACSDEETAFFATFDPSFVCP